MKKEVGADDLKKIYNAPIVQKNISPCQIWKGENQVRIITIVKLNYRNNSILPQFFAFRFYHRLFFVGE